MRRDVPPLQTRFQLERGTFPVDQAPLFLESPEAAPSGGPLGQEAGETLLGHPLSVSTWALSSALGTWMVLEGKGCSFHWPGDVGAVPAVRP